MIFVLKAATSVQSDPDIAHAVVTFARISGIIDKPTKGPLAASVKVLNASSNLHTCDRMFQTNEADSSVNVNLLKYKLTLFCLPKLLYHKGRIR